MKHNEDQEAQQATTQTTTQGSEASTQPPEATNEFFGGLLDIAEAVLESISDTGAATVECAGGALDCVGEVIGAILDV